MLAETVNPGLSGNLRVYLGFVELPSQVSGKLCTKKEALGIVCKPPLPDCEVNSNANWFKKIKKTQATFQEGMATLRQIILDCLGSCLAWDGPSNYDV